MDECTERHAIVPTGREVRDVDVLTTQESVNTTTSYTSTTKDSYKLT